jgi:hypothetical protein
LFKPYLAAALVCAAALPAFAQQNTLPEAPTPQINIASVEDAPALPDAPMPQSSSSTAAPDTTNSVAAKKNKVDCHCVVTDEDTPQVDANGKPIPTSRQQPKRILGLMPNYRAVTGGATPPPPTAKTNFKIATRQAFDYSSFVFLGITSLAAQGLDEHPSLGKGVPGFWAYSWRGFLDKTDGNYLGGFLLPTILHEDTRYYAMGTGNPWKRVGYAASRTVVTRTYGQHNTFNFSNIGGMVAAQAISKTYYPAGTTPFGVLTTKFGYAIARGIGFTVFREFYPDIATHVLHRHP